jgi:RimJ/RimL family protein N-acetyltransferase
MKNFKFVKMSDQFRPLIGKWSREDHLADYRLYIEKNFNDDSFVVLLQDKPIGMILDSKGVSDSEVQIKHFIGIPEFVNKGIGSLFIKKFTDDLLRNKKIKKITADPKLIDLRAQKSLIKAGFKIDRRYKDVDYVHMIKST